MTQPLGQSHYNIQTAWDIMQELTGVLEGKSNGDAVAASLLLAYCSVQDPHNVMELSAEKVKKIIEEGALFFATLDQSTKH